MCGPESFRTHRKAGSDELLKIRIIFRSIVDGDIDYIMVLFRVFTSFWAFFFKFKGGGGAGAAGVTFFWKVMPYGQIKTILVS